MWLPHRLALPARRQVLAAQAMLRRSPVPPGRLSARPGGPSCGFRDSKKRESRISSARIRLGERAARDFTSGGSYLQHLLASLCPGIESVSLVTLGPDTHRLLALTTEPECAAKLKVRFDEVGSQLESLAEKCLGVFIHFTFQVYQTKIVVRVQSGLPIVVETDGLRQVLDRLTEDPFLQADIPHVDACQCIRRLLHQHPGKVAQRLIVVLMKHLGPPEQRLCLDRSRREAERFIQRLDRPGVVSERNEAPTLL